MFNVIVTLATTSDQLKWPHLQFSSEFKTSTITSSSGGDYCMCTYGIQHAKHQILPGIKVRWHHESGWNQELKLMSFNL